MILKLRYWPDPILKEECSECHLPTADRQALGKEMTRLMFANNGVGLAGPQAGLQLRIFVMRDPEAPTKGLAFVNPDLDYLGPKKESDWEGCLSLPWGSTRRHRVMIERSTEIEFSFDDPADVDNRLRWRFEGMNARVVQHELDHLNGVMIFDYITGELPKKMYMQKYMKDRKKYAKIG